MTYYLKVPLMERPEICGPKVTIIDRFPVYALSGGVGHDITIIASRVRTVHFSIEFSSSKL